MGFRDLLALLLHWLDGVPVPLAVVELTLAPRTLAITLDARSVSLTVTARSLALTVEDR